MPAETAGHTIVLDYNDIPGIEEAFNKWGQEIAAVIVEPVAGNMNLVAPKVDFLARLRTLCTQSGSVLIFDEVMTGFRVGLGCAQGLYQIKPDLSALGKVIGGGMPMAAFGGRRDIMQCLAPLADGLERQNPLHEWFESGVFSSRVKLGKPDPAIFALAAARYGSAPGDCLLIDDNAANIAAAQACGWQAERFVDAPRLLLALRQRGLLA